MKNLPSYIGIIKTSMTKWWWFQTFLNFSPRFVWGRWSNFTLAYYFQRGWWGHHQPDMLPFWLQKWRTQSYFHIEMMAFSRTSWLILTAFGCWRYDPGLLVSTSARVCWSDAGGLYQRLWRNDWLALLYLLWAETGQRIQCSLDVLPLQVEDNWTQSSVRGRSPGPLKSALDFIHAVFIGSIYCKDRLPQHAGRRNRPRDSGRLAQTCVDQPNLSGRKRMQSALSRSQVRMVQWLNCKQSNLLVLLVIPILCCQQKLDETGFIFNVSSTLGIRC